jgi:hypothetical protein
LISKSKARQPSDFILLHRSEVFRKDPKMKQSKYTQATLDRLRANSEAAKKRLERLNHEYLLRQKVRRMPQPKTKTATESFAEAVIRIARENQLAL